MKTAFIADVHGNLEAFRAVRAALAHEQAERVIFLGDIVGYGANPNECIQELRQVTGYAVVGNHDRVAMGSLSPDRFNPHAQAAISWTRARLTGESKSVLTDLPLQLEMGSITAVHATPFKPESWTYISSSYDAAEAFRGLHGQLCFSGHTHRPGVFIEHADASVAAADAAEITLEPQCRYFINCGSVGQPRDGDPRACYGLYDSTAGTYRLKRVRYDVTAAQKKILQAGLPPFLAERLSAGR